MSGLHSEIGGCHPADRTMVVDARVRDEPEEEEDEEEEDDDDHKQDQDDDEDGDSGGYSE